MDVLVSGAIETEASWTRRRWLQERALSSWLLGSGNLVWCENASCIISHPFSPLPPLRPQEIRVNMMPIYLNRRPEGNLPDFLLGYRDLIYDCCRNRVVYESNEDFFNRIGYLTVHESFVPEGRCQRRPGLHIERPGSVVLGNGRWMKPDDPYYSSLCWGLGSWDGRSHPVDGIFMCSNVDDSCAVWPAQFGGVTDHNGSIEHLRGALEFSGVRPRLLKANELCWMTDTTPHESLPLKADGYRQFFRLVVGKISVWYSRHNTPNPCGVQPDAPVSCADKFSRT